MTLGQFVCFPICLAILTSVYIVALQSKDGIFVDMMTANSHTDSKCTDYTLLSTTWTVDLTSRDVQSPEFESLQ